MSYLAIKHIHMTTAAITAVLFLLRGIWMLQSSSMLHRRWVKIVPHVNDTILLASAVTLAIWSAQYPLQQHWLTAKVLLLIAYIVVGAVALKRGRSKGVRAIAFIFALFLLGTIFKIALTRQIM